MQAFGGEPSSARLAAVRTWFTLRRLVLVVSVALVLSAIGFGAYVGIADSDLGGNFWQTVAAEFLAAALAIGVGIPVGLWLNDLAHRAEVRDRQAQEAETRRQTLASLQRELEDARVWIDAATVDTIRQPGPSTIRWEAASQAGNLRLLDAKTLDLLAVTYFLLHEVNACCRRFHDARIGPAAEVRTEDGERVMLVAAQEVVDCAAVTGAHVANALERLRAVLQDAGDGPANPPPP